MYGTRLAIGAVRGVGVAARFLAHIPHGGHSVAEKARPKGVDKKALWNEGRKEWELGAYSKANCQTGVWQWWRPDGTLSCRSSFDAKGRLEGIARRFHPSGEVSLWAAYSKNLPHGREIQLRHTKGRSPENPTFKGLDKAIYRIECLLLRGDRKESITLYGKAGVAFPLPKTQTERATNLHGLVSAMLPATALVKIGSALDIASHPVPGTVKSEFLYQGLASTDAMVHRILLIQDKRKKEIILSLAQLEKCFVPSVDYGVGKL